LLKRIWTKIGPRFQHTNERLLNTNILKFDDEIKLQEVKLIWRWDKNKIPKGLINLITENRGRELRNRQFQRSHGWKKSSISYRLATRAMKEINEITCARSKNGLKNKYKRIIRLTYTGNCRIRNCYICNRAPV